MASLAPLSYGFVTEEIPMMESWSHGEVLDQKPKMPKQEGLNTKDFAFELLKLNNGATNDSAMTEPLIKFFACSPPMNYSLGMIDGTDFTDHLSHLYLQKSSQPTQPQSDSENKYIFDFRPTESSSSSFSKYQIKSASVTMKRSAPYRQREAGAARKRRQRISEKTRYLEKLLPWNRRTDTATMLEERHKYVKFLHAQIRVLQSMPIYSSGFYDSSISNEKANLNEFGGGVRARLKRQQLLKVVLNSSARHRLCFIQEDAVFIPWNNCFLTQKMAEEAATKQMLFPCVHY